MPYSLKKRLYGKLSDTGNGARRIIPWLVLSTAIAVFQFYMVMAFVSLWFYFFIGDSGHSYILMSADFRGVIFPTPFHPRVMYGSFSLLLFVMLLVSCFLRKGIFVATYVTIVAHSLFMPFAYVMDFPKGTVTNSGLHSLPIVLSNVLVLFFVLLVRRQVRKRYPTLLSCGE
ncbi:MAG: hypothetical protein CVV45_17750 [Spirochaetae bacterium HGW-Spirochaetae-10]|nr:MAG: hypothetical protein CVV45_17750 [Spirochaetae bacterium HGW-Spirochaetae-10]